MKKIVVMIVVVIILIICSLFVILSNKTTDNNISNNVDLVDSSTTNKESGNSVTEEIIEDETINYDENKKYVYLINNEVLATRIESQWYDAEASTITLSDLFNSEAFYSFDKKVTTNEIAVNEFLREEWGDDTFNNIHELLGEETLIETAEAEIWGLGDAIPANQYTYKLPAYVKDENNLDVKDCLRVYTPFIDIANEQELYSNDGNLKMIKAVEGNALSEASKKWLDDYIEQNYYTISGDLNIKSYELNIDQDSNLEKVYLVYSNFDYPIVDEDKICMIIIENDSNLFGHLISKSTFRSKDSNEFWDYYKEAWQDNISIRFADFDHDGKVEILADSYVLEPESYDYHELYRITADSLELLATNAGPNN